MIITMTRLVGIGMDRGLQTDRREKVPRYGRDHIRWYDNWLERRLRRRHFLEEESTALQELDCQQLILPYGDPLYKATQNPAYLDWFKKNVDWYMRTGMINTNIYQIEDGTKDDCTPNRNAHYTYNQGVASLS